ncbi:hypothetical protein HGRIS_000574 [Hohenbuehelia grisea]|uniref:Aminoglycoside phosphotransferase domain-containing protein n=1 Tax=Hohenbuehelia grisea TaxID=104357 RepID=A0ABR3JSC8_9AGAR
MSADSLEPEDILWEQTNPDLGAYRAIIEGHFGSPCTKQEPLEPGAYSRVFLYTMQDGLKIVGKVVLPARRTIKTEAEVAAMDTMRAHTSIPIPKVHLYCSTPDNPVGAEWIVMDYVPGQRLADCWDELGYEKKTKTAKDLARVMAEMFVFTSSHCGSLLRDLSLADDQRSRRYHHVTPDHPSSPAEEYKEVLDGSYLLGPVNDVAFLTLTNIISTSSCGPFSTERELLEAVAYRNELLNGASSLDRLDRWPLERMFELYDIFRSLYQDHVPTFTFAHGDLSGANILVDPRSGTITGVIDWEMAGFRPRWLGATPRTWFNDDPCRFVVEDSMDGPDGYDEDSEADAELRNIFLAELQALSPELLRHNREGVELRAFFYNLCHEFPSNTTAWIIKYEKYHWDTIARGPFPFDLRQWRVDLLDLFEKIHREA